MATVTRRTHADVVVLHRVPYQLYVHLTNAWANRHLRMAYHDGTLEIVSPRRREHERPSRRLSFIVTTIAEHLDQDGHAKPSLVPSVLALVARLASGVRGARRRD